MRVIYITILIKKIIIERKIRQKHMRSHYEQL